MIENYLDKIKQRLNVVVLHAVVYTRYSSDMQRGECTNKIDKKMV